MQTIDRLANDVAARVAPQAIAIPAVAPSFNTTTYKGEVEAMPTDADAEAVPTNIDAEAVPTDAQQP